MITNVGNLTSGHTKTIWGKKKHGCKLTRPLVKVDLDSEFLWNLAKLILIYFPMTKITQNLITFVPFVQNFQNNKHSRIKSSLMTWKTKWEAKVWKLGGLGVQSNPNKQGVHHSMALSFTIKRYRKAKEELSKFKYFTMQKYSLQRKKKPKSFKVS
jgi:hypothetical protein